MGRKEAGRKKRHHRARHTLTHTQKHNPHLTRQQVRPPAPSALLLTCLSRSPHRLQQQRLLPPRAGAQWVLIVHGVHTWHFLEGAHGHTRTHTPPPRTRPRARTHTRPPRTLTPAHTHDAAALMCSARGFTCNVSIGRMVAARGSRPGHRCPASLLGERINPSKKKRKKKEKKRKKGKKKKKIPYPFTVKIVFKATSKLASAGFCWIQQLYLTAGWLTVTRLRPFIFLTPQIPKLRRQTPKRVFTYRL